MNAIRIGLVFRHDISCYRAILRGIRRYAESKADWHFIPITPEAAALSRLRQLKPAGLIGQAYHSALAQQLAAFRCPLVNTTSYNIAAILNRRHVPNVGSDNRQVGQLAATYFLDRGFCHFGFFGDSRRRFSLQREASFRAAVESAGHSFTCFHEPRQLPFQPLYHLWSDDAPLLRWLLTAPKPIGVFVCQDAWGVHLMEACRQAEIAVPDEVAVLGVDNDDLLCGLSRPPLSSIAPPHERIGYVAAELLDQLLQGRKPAHDAWLFPPLGVTTRLSTDVLALEDVEVAAAVRFIREHAHLPLRVADILRTVPLSRRSLEQRFRKALRRGLAEEIRRVHLERATTLLTDTDLSMEQIGARAGFANGRQFATTFRLQLGLTPSAYRRRFRQRSSLSTA